MGKDKEQYECGDCGHRDTRDFFPLAEDLFQRLTVGDIFTDVECPECGALAHPVEVSTPNWENNAIQYPRLIAELQMAGAFSQEVMEFLSESTDLSYWELGELVDRACEEWDAIKAAT